MPASAASGGPAADLHDSPTGRAIQAAARQAQRARRAEIVRQRQRAALLELLVQTMADLHISMAELNAARRAMAPAWKTPDDGAA
ncbi:MULTISPECIES: hypothetical protein [Variovorax]|jgi:hypothetical protein|uniref:hypothetical protein n=1 Tax=Variovorax TaxID=34072 RepID=UPI00086893B3|nr:MULTISPECIES: hypothetical protein [Variovorax]MBN8758129.1 hypothetical protein [Variovorax sp.]ODU13042.1 MAG: hypothetical protein ABS94_28240 [Variovorax sp. SCN 67-85]ODV16372.1 MAG: hypothetical protein ABT25_31380 [Variovorax sp. SCN 67-20]UKI11065.1 hypothetical protein L3V85_14815 [Variovorax paradoxus]